MHLRRSTLRLVAVTAALTLATTAACSSSSSKSSSSEGSKGGTTTFTYWTSGWTPAQIAETDAAFDRTHPGLHANGQYIASSDQYLPQVISAIKSGTQPTVLLTQDPSDLPEIAQSGKVIPLDGKLTQQTSTLYPGIRKNLFYKGKQLGMALAGVGDIVLFYNKKDFATAGIAGPPATWDELAADAAKLSNPGGKHYGFYVPLGEAEWISYAWEPMLWANGGTFLNSAGTRTAFNSPAGVQALTTWVNLIKSHSAPTTSFAQAGSFDGVPAFASHTVSMLVDGQWALTDFKKAGIDFGVAPFPKGSAGPSTNIGLAVAALLKTSAAQDNAGLEFLKFLSTPEQGAHLAARNSGLPDDPAQLQQPELKSFIAANPDFQVFAQNEASGGTRPLIPTYNAVSQALWTEINQALQGKETPAQALANAARKGDAILSGQD
jgi:multiple sugar transport system substrate-binding protein